MRIANYLKNISLSSTRLILLTTLFWMVFANTTFFSALLKDYPFTEDPGFVIAVTIGFAGVLALAQLLLLHRYTLKPILIVLLLMTSSSAYFMDTYNNVINVDMVHNVVNTDSREVTDLTSVRQILYLIFLGIIPSLFVFFANVTYLPLAKELFLRLKLMAAILVVMALLYLAFSAAFSSFFREHKTIRYYFTPANYVFAIGKYVSAKLSRDTWTLKKMGEDAEIPTSDVDRELIIVVVGETARYDHFSLNGYTRKTNPKLEKEQVVSFSDFTSCGTSTAISVPCMFAYSTTDDFDAVEAKRTENALDILKRAGVSILWRDNNSSSKGVADRVPYQDWRSPDINPICDTECRDEGMLSGLQEYIDEHKTGDIMFVLHQMGNHGPAYYKRYPKEFEKFTPTCQTNELAECSTEEISNAYDNAILYTDHFLARTIELLKANDDRFETAMIYISDHGESLGESGMYLHGLPNFIAPETQRHVPMIVWTGENFDEITYDELYAKRNQPLTHDNIFHTLLAIMEIESDLLDPEMNILQGKGEEQEQ